MYTEITKNTFNIIFEKRYALIKALLLPFILLTIIQYFLNPIIKDSIGTYNLYLLGGLSFIITIVMSILIHRILLLESSETATWGVYKLGSREINFILKAIGLVIIVIIIFIGITLILTFIGNLVKAIIGNDFLKMYPFVAVGISSILTGIIGGRFSLVFPAISIDKPIDFADSYFLTKNYKLLTLLMVVVIPISLAFAIELAYGVVIKFLIGVISSNFSILYSFLNVFITVITIGFLSITYEYIISQQPEKVEKPIGKPIYEETKLGSNITIDDRSEISFEDIKEQLKKQYFSLGYTRIVIDKDDSWMTKDINNEKSYILLSHKNDEYKIETFNVEKTPTINI